MEAHIQKLERLNRDFLDVSRVQAGRLDYVQETVDLDELLSEIAEAMYQLYPTHTIVMRGAAKTQLIGDRDRLEQVCTNLLSNAIKYSPTADTVELEIGSTAEAITVCVRDHGIGIPPEQREKIFERFYRAVDPSTNAFPGMGMGLYIVAEIVKDYEGTITVESEIGKGSAFQVTLPLTRQAESAELEHLVAIWLAVTLASGWKCQNWEVGAFPLAGACRSRTNCSIPINSIRTRSTGERAARVVVQSTTSGKDTYYESAEFKPATELTLHCRLEQRFYINKERIGVTYLS
jgi:anti-sigma regulatory factor (Ser/Thr protein kinase)